MVEVDSKIYTQQTKEKDLLKKQELLCKLIAILYARATAKKVLQTPHPPPCMHRDSRVSINDIPVIPVALPIMKGVPVPGSMPNR